VRKSILLSLIVAPSLALASGYSLPNTNPRDLGMSASAVAAQRDSGAAFALPAALARLRGPFVSVGGGVVNVFNEWTDPSATPNGTQPPFTSVLPPPAVPGPAEPSTAELDVQYTAIPNISVAYGGKADFLGGRGWGVGLGIQPFGGAILEWPSDWAGRYRITDIDRQVFSVIASAGIEVIPQVRIGGGVMYYRTMQNLKLKGWMEPFTAPLPVAGTPDASATLDMDGDAWTYSVSAEIDPIRGVPLTIAVDYKHKATQDLDGDVTFSGLQPGATAPTSPVAPLYTASSAEEELTIPNLLNVGVAYRFAKPLLATFTYTFDRWVVYNEDRFRLNTGIPFVVDRQYGNGHTFRAGAEYDLSRAFQVRGGVQRDLSGLTTSTYSPTLPDSDSWGVSLGGTFRFGRGFSVDAAVFYANFDEVTSTDNGLEPGFYPPLVSPSNPLGALPVPANGTFRGTYNPQALVYTFAVAWTPGARAPAE
jgi:long-chain fatty acid transport protein